MAAAVAVMAATGVASRAHERRPSHAGLQSVSCLPPRRRREHIDRRSPALSPRKADLTVYLWPPFDHREELLASPGTHSCGKGCLHIERLTDVHLPTPGPLIERSVTVALAREDDTTVGRTSGAGLRIGNRERPIR